MKQTKQNRTLVLSRRAISVKSISALAVGMAGLGICLTGCGNGLGTSTTSVAPVAAGKGTIQGKIYGGQQPVVGAKIQLYYVGSNGLGSNATPLIPSADQVVYNGSAGTGALTDSSGGFRITGDYTCPTVSQQVYLVATGGTSQGAGGSVNSAIALMAPLGDCATLALNAATTSVQINEITTVASVYALAPYMTGYANVGAASVNNTGLINAVGNFSNLANIATGNAGGASLPTGATVPVAEINTLANVIASCVNSPLATASPCTTLATATSATDTVGMLLAFAKNPASAALTALYGQGAATAPFQPSLTTQPSDWSVAIKYTAGGVLNAPYNVAIDSVGNAWVTNTAGGTVTEFTPAGAVANNYTLSSGATPKGIAIDRLGSVWVADSALNAVQKLTLTNPTTVSGAASYTVGGLNGPVAIAIDSANNAWIANLTGNSVTELSTAGAATQTSLTAGGTISQPSGIALDTGGNVYVANNGGGNVVKLTNAGTVASGSPFTDNALQGTINVALDSSNGVYALGSTTGSVSQVALGQFTSAGVAASYSPVSGTFGTASGVYPGIVVTSANNVLLTNSVTSGNLQAVALGASSVGNTYGSLNAPIGLAVDLSGDVWTANSGDNTVSVFVGLTKPVATPLAANVGP